MAHGFLITSLTAGGMQHLDSAALINTTAYSSMEKEAFSWLTSPHRGKPGAEAARAAASQLLPGFLRPLSMYPRPVCPGTTHSGLGPDTSIGNQENAPQMRL